MLVPLAANRGEKRRERAPRARSGRRRPHGDASSRCRPPRAMRRTASRRTSASLALHAGTRSAPSPRSTNRPRSPLTKRSVTNGSSRNGRRKVSAGVTPHSGVEIEAGGRGGESGHDDDRRIAKTSCALPPGGRWTRQERSPLGRNVFRQQRRRRAGSGQNASPSRTADRKEWGRHPYSGGRGMPPRAGEKLGGSPRRDAEAMFGR